MQIIWIAALIAVASLSLTSQPASAAAWCSGTIAHSWIDSDGRAYVLGSWRGDHTQICNVKVEWKSITPDVCLSWVAKIDSAIAFGRTVTVYYRYENEDVCPDLPTYGASPAPGYIMLN